MNQPSLFDPVAQPERFKPSAHDLAPSKRLERRGSAPLEPQPGARNTDPCTSHEAADEVHETSPDKPMSKSEWRARFACLVLKELAEPATYAELFERIERRYPLEGFEFESKHEVGRRMPDARTLGLASKSESRKCTISGRSCQTWKPTGAHPVNGEFQKIRQDLITAYSVTD